MYTYVYMQNDQRDSFLWHFRVYFLYSKGVAFLANHGKQVAAGYALLAAVFWGLVLRSVVYLIRIPSLRWPALPWRANRVIAAQTIVRMQSVGSRSTERTQSAISSSVTQRVSMVHARWEGLFGMRGPYFELRLLVEEILEIGAQTIAAYSASQSISNVPLNILYAVVIFLSCIASLVIRRVFKSSLIKQRFACLLTDIVIDFAWGTALPIWMYMPLLNAYRHRANFLEQGDDYSNSTRGIERVLILSWPYYALSVIPFCNALLGFIEVQNILLELMPSSNKGKSNSGLRSTASIKTHPEDDTSMQLQLRYPVGRRKPGLIVKLIHALFPVYGIAVLLTVLASNGVFQKQVEQTESICRHRVYPWFSTKEACLGREVHCGALGLAGSTSELEPILQSFDEKSLADMAFINCSGLVMPPKIYSFPNLMTLSVRESTLLEWGEDAALTDEAFSDLRMVELSRVQLAKDPIGLIGVKPIAWSMEWIHLESMDAASMLARVGDHWRSLLFFDCMGCGLTAIPEPLFAMPRQLNILLIDNNISTVSDQWTAGLAVQLQAVWMDHNPLLTELPDALWKQAATLGIFSFADTNLSFVPEWVADVAGQAFSLFAPGTPLCNKIETLSTRLQGLLVC